MSHYMTALAMKQKGLKPAAKIVLYWIADHHNGETGQCNPSIKRLADCCEMSRRSVENHIASLESAGLVSVEQRYRDKGGKTANSYTLHMPDSDAQNLRMGYAKSAHGVCAKSAHDRTLEDTNLGNEPLSRNALDSEFEEFWNTYPHRGGAKKGKTQARKKWQAALKAGADPLAIIQGARRYANDAQVVRGYAQNPETWLNQRRWDDEVEPEQTQQQKGTHNGKRSVTDRLAARFAAMDSREGGNPSEPLFQAGDRRENRGSGDDGLDSDADGLFQGPNIVRL